VRKRRSGVPSVRPEPGSDFGPSLRTAHGGRLVAWGGAATIDLEYRADPAIPEYHKTVRGARRRDVLADLLARHVITKPMRDAAEQFLSDCSIAAGGSSGDLTGMPSHATPRAGLPERQLNAISRINRVRALLGLHDRTVFWHVVFHNLSLNDFENRNHLRSGAATTLLIAALNALDAHYSPPTRRKRA
jgi:hypothetical protein